MHQDYDVMNLLWGLWVMIGHMWSMCYHDMLCFHEYIYMFKLMRVVWMFTLVTLKWCLSVDGGMGHYSCIEPSITWGLLWGKKVKVKEKRMLRRGLMCLKCDIVYVNMK